MSGVQRAAVALYGLAPQDRDAILADLPPQDSATLRVQLRELEQLGFERGAAPLLQADTGRLPAGADALSSASAEALFAVLQSEPASLVAQVLALRDWDCKAELLERFTPQRRGAIAAVPPAPLAPALAQWLDQRLRQQLALALPQRQAPAGWRAKWAKAKSWIR